MHRRPERFLLTLAVTSAILAPVHAAELGEARVSSHIGQQLVADIELAMIDDPSARVGVRLASPEVYNGAGIAMPPVLSSLNLTVMRRDGRQFLHVTSLRPVDAEHLHLYLELSDKGQRAVRLATLWLTPDPNPAPAPQPVAAPVPVPAPPAAMPVAHAGAPAPRIQPRAVPAQPHAPTLAPRVLETRVPETKAADSKTPERKTPERKTPEAKTPETKTPETKTPETKTPETRAPATRADEPKAAQPKPPLVLPVASIKTGLPAAHGEAAPAACMHPARDAQACMALDARNAALRAQLGKLEEKVKRLQATLGIAPTPAGTPPTPATIDTQTMRQAQKTRDAHDAHDAHGQAPKAAHHEAAPADAAKAAHAALPAAAKPGDATRPEAAVKPEATKTETTKPEATKPESAANSEEAAKPPEPVKPAGPKPISSIKPLVPHKPKTPPPDEGLPWGAVGAGLALLAALGGGAALLAKRRGAARKAGVPADPGLLDKLRQRFADRNKVPAPAVEKVAEPSLD